MKGNYKRFYNYATNDTRTKLNAFSCSGSQFRVKEFFLALTTYNGTGVFVVISRCQYFAFFGTEFSIALSTFHSGLGHSLKVTRALPRRGHQSMKIALISFVGG